MPHHKVLIDKKNNEESLLLYEVLGGKLNNKLLPSEQSLSQRVVRPKQKGLTCLYHSTRMLANRVGKHPDLQNTPERQVEIKLSKARKNVFISKLQDDACNLLLDYADNFDNCDNKTNIAWVKHNVVSLNGTDTEKKEFIEAVVAFAAARDANKTLKFKPFIKARRDKEMRETAIQNLAILGINFHDELKKYQGDFRFEMDRLAHLTHTDDEFSYLMSNMMQSHAQLTLEHFKPLPWSASTEFDVLSNHLKEHGPLLATGRYGQTYYQPGSDHRLALGKAELSLGQTVNLSAQYWTAEERETETQMIAHVIIVVGLHAKGNSKLVYFVDPEDVSKPDEPSKIYAMSYKTFCQYAAVTDVISTIQSNAVAGHIYAKPPEPENPKLKMKY